LPNQRFAFARAGRVGALALTALVPLLLCVALCYYESARIVRREATIASTFIVSQVSSIIDEAHDAAQQFVLHVDDACDVLMPNLSLTAAVVPYVRTIDVIDEDHVSCSSVRLNQGMPWGAPANGMPQTPSGSWMMLADSTPMTPGRAALLVGVRASDGRSVVASVDGRYLLDLMRAAAPVGMFRRVELDFEGYPPLSDTRDGSSSDTSPMLADVRKTTASGAFDLRIYGLRAHRRAALLGLLANYLPWAAVLSALLVWLVRRLQQSRRSRRERLLRGIRMNEFYVEYQPLYGVASGRCEGAEALMRWKCRGVGIVRPDVFIAAAEDEEVIVPLTQHLLKLIARDVARMKLKPGFHLGINFAPDHLSSPRMMDDIHALREALGPDGPQIVVEVTERSLIRNTDQAQRNLEQVRKEGAEVAIDDFGTGYCSLSYLERFPFDLLKIDRGFVLTIDSEERRAVVLDSIIDLAHSLGARLVAEGVETQTQYDYLCGRGVAYIQGFIYARPMGVDAFCQWYEATGDKRFAPRESKPRA